MTTRGGDKDGVLEERKDRARDAATRGFTRLLDTTAGLSAREPDAVRGEHAGSVESRVRWLLEAAEPCDAHPLQKHRVWLKMSKGSTGRRSVAFGRTAIALGTLLMLLGGTAIASAALGHWPGWAVRAYEQMLPSSASDSASGVPVRDPMVGRGHKSAHRSGLAALGAQGEQTDHPAIAAGVSDQGRPALAAETAVQTVRAPAPRALSPVASTSPRDGATRRETVAAAARAPRRLAQITAPTEDDGPVLAAMRALRRDRDPVRARALLRKYLADRPNGALAEEALAITIEAAVAHHDSDAQLLAARYLQIYPAGPFRSLALQTLNGRPEAAPKR